MSLDVYLRRPGVGAPPEPEILVRKNGAMVRVSREEWDRDNPGREPVTLTSDPFDGEVYTRNITHNLGAMAREAGVYLACWRPEEMGATKGKHLIEPLRAGLSALRANPERFRAMNPENGWGDYDGLVAFVADYLAACEAYPDADVSVSR